MTNKLYFKRKGISFTGALTLLASLFLIDNIFSGGQILLVVDLKSSLMIFLYILIGLSLEDYNGIGMVIERVWNLNCGDDVDDETKISLIKAYLGMQVTQWVKLWKLWEIIVNNKKDDEIWSRKQKLKFALLRIPKGQLSLRQFLWILGYIIWCILKTRGYLPPITVGFESIIDFAGLGFFIYTSGSVIGLSKFMTDVFQSIAPSDERSTKSSLSLLEANIVYGARYYGFLREVVDMKCESNIESNRLQANQNEAKV